VIGSDGRDEDVNAACVIVLSTLSQKHVQNSHGKNKLSRVVSAETQWTPVEAQSQV